mmetsp:Transcript_65135/g.174637  ORF Transcript_65135/g.174637 Transcript_65135/m.174637 type:complete len:1358 (-) Transcript_65135:208-4281(-)
MDGDRVVLASSPAQGHELVSVAVEEAPRWAPGQSEVPSTVLLTAKSGFASRVCKPLANRYLDFVQAYPLCALCGALLLLVGFFALGFGVFHWPIEAPSTDFDSFKRTDTSVSIQRDGYLDSLQARWNPYPARRLNSKSARITEPGSAAQLRRLSKYLLAPYDFTLLYVGGSGIDFFDEEPMKALREFETAVKRLPSFRILCVQKIEIGMMAEGCMPGTSLVNFAWPSLVLDENSLDVIPTSLTFDGNGTELMPRAAIISHLREIRARELQAYPALEDMFLPAVTAAFDSAEATVPRLDTLRSSFTFYVLMPSADATDPRIEPAVEQAKSHFLTFLTDELTPLMNQFNADHPGMTVVASAGELESQLINDALFELPWESFPGGDVFLATFSTVFVLILLSGYTRSCCLSIVGIGLVFLSIPVAYASFVIGCQVSGGVVSQLSSANLLSLFIMIGIGADLLFVFTDAWKHGLRHQESLSVAEQRRAALGNVYSHAAMSCAATTLSTAASFYANLASVLPALREFGFFMGSSVAAAYVIVLTTYPPLLVLAHKWGCQCCCCCCCCSRRQRKAANAQVPQEQAAAQLPADRQPELAQVPQEQLGQGIPEVPAHSQLQPARATAGEQHEAETDGGCNLRHFLARVWAPFLWRWRHIVVFSIAVLSVGAGVLALSEAELDSSAELNVFPSDHPYEVAEQLKSEFKTPEKHETTDGPRPRPLEFCRIGERGRPYGIQFRASRLYGGSDGGTSRRRTDQPGASAKLEDALGRLECAWYWCEAAADPHVFSNSSCQCKGRMAPSDDTGLGGCQAVDRSAVSATVSAYFWRVGEGALEGVELTDRIRGGIAQLPQLANASFRVTYLSDGSRMPDVVQQNWESGEVAVSRHTLDGQWAVEIDISTLREDVEELCDYHEVCHCLASECVYPGADRAAWQDRDSLPIRDVTEEPRVLQATSSPQTGIRPLSMSPIPQHLMKQVTVLFGIDVEESGPLLGAPGRLWSFDSRIDFNNVWTQRIMKSICDDMPYDLMVFADSCVMDSFYDFVRVRSGGSGLFFPTEDFHGDMLSFVNPAFNGAAFQRQFWQDLWFGEGDQSGRLMALKLEFPTAAPSDSEKLKQFKAKWDDYISSKNAEASKHFGSGARAWHTAEIWKEAVAVEATLESVQVTIVLAIALGLLGSWIFTQMLKLAMMVMLSVVLVICWQLFFMVTMMKWKIGAIEVISLIVFIGYSITYCIHLVHAYATHTTGSEGQGSVKARHKRTAFALGAMGGAIMGSATTTLVSAVFLLFCQVVIFTKFGAVICAITLLSIFFSLVFLPALLMGFGPIPDSERSCAPKLLTTCVASRYEQAVDDTIAESGSEVSSEESG